MKTFKQILSPLFRKNQKPAAAKPRAEMDWEVAGLMQLAVTVLLVIESLWALNLATVFFLPLTVETYAPSLPPVRLVTAGPLVDVAKYHATAYEEDVAIARAKLKVQEPLLLLLIPIVLAILALLIPFPQIVPTVLSITSLMLFVLLFFY